MAPFLLAIAVLGRAAQNMGQTTFPLIARQLLGIGNAELGSLTAVAGLAGVLTAATLAARTTATSALRVLSVGQCLVLTSFVLFAIPSGRAGLWVAAVVLGVGGGLVFPAAMTSIGAASAGRRARALAVFAVSLSFGLVLGPLIEAEVLHLLSGSLRGAFAAMVPLPALATAISIAAAIHQHRAVPGGPGDPTVADPVTRPAEAPGRAVPGTETRAADLPSTDVPSLTAALGTAPPARSPSGEPAVFPDGSGPGHFGAPGPSTRLLSFPAYRLALATMLTYQAPFAALVTFGALLARHVDGASAAGASLAFGVFFAVSMAVRGVVAVKAPIRHQRAVLSGAVLATAAGIAILGGASGFLVLLVGMAVLGVPHGLTFPMASAVLADGVPLGTLGRANARLMASTNLVTIAVPFACGWLASAVGYRDMYLVMEIPVVAFGSLLASALRSYRRSPPSARITSAARAATIEP